MSITKSKNTIKKKIKHRELENIEALKQIENTLSKNRGFVFKLPKEQSPVIMLFSGGMDSVALTFMLLEKYKLHIYPIFIKRSQQRTGKELKSAKFYISELQKRYGNLCENLEVIKSAIPPNKIRYPLALFSNTPYYKKTKSKQLKGLPVYTLSLASLAVQYACFLKITKKITVRTIFCGFTVGDGTVMAYETLTALRSTMASICLLQNDFSWQFASLALEKELGFFLEKHEIIKWCNEHSFKLDKTWSCYYSFHYHCGECMGCGARQEHFRKSDVKDTTIYQKPNRLEQILYKIWSKTYEAYRQFNF